MVYVVTGSESCRLTRGTIVWNGNHILGGECIKCISREAIKGEQQPSD